MRNRRRLLVFVGVCCLLLGSVPNSVLASEPAVAKRLYDLGGRLEISLAPAFSIFDKYTQHVGASVGLAYYFNDYIGLEVEGGYAFLSGDVSLLDEILEVGVDNISGIERLPLTDLKYTTWWATGGLVFSPLYGKLNLSAEIDFNFHFYMVAGAGVAGYKYSQLEWPTDTEFRKVEKDVGAKPTFYVGGGLRMHFTQNWSLRIEIRDHFYYDEYEAQTKSAGGTTPDPKKIEDFVHITLMRLGVCYSFF